MLPTLTILSLKPEYDAIDHLLLDRRDE